jgi:hypothetical protein
MLQKMLMQNKLAIVAVTFAVLLLSCQGGNKPNAEGQTGKDSVNMKELSQEVKSVIYPLPTPFEMTQMLNDMGAKYNSSSLNPVNKAEKYMKANAKALNLGVYGADLAYAATFDQKQDINVYSKTVKSLIDDLGVSIDYSNMLSDQFREKVNNKDTLTKIITNTFYSTYKDLDEKSKPDQAILMVSGMWVELMYIATHISENTYNNTNLVRLIVSQKDSYEKLTKLLGDRNSDKDIKDMETQLLVLKPSFDKVKNGLTEDDYKLILKTIQSVRNKIVS